MHSFSATVITYVVNLARVQIVIYDLKIDKKKLKKTSIFPSKLQTTTHQGHNYSYLAFPKKVNN